MKRRKIYVGTLLLYSVFMLSSCSQIVSEENEYENTLESGRSVYKDLGSDVGNHIFNHHVHQNATRHK